MAYIHDRRRLLGGYLPQRRNVAPDVPMPEPALWDEFRTGSGERAVSTTMAFVRILTKLLKDKQLGRHIVPIVPDEARTFGMEALFRQCGIYSHVGQLYEPVDADQLMYYKEARDGQILEEGINEAGSMSSFIAAGTAYANQSVYTIPFYIYYSMFGFQRIGDLIWAAADLRTRGFLVGGTAGRTTLNGEGLQHQDGHSHLLAMSVPNLQAYDPAFAYEIAVIVREGLRRMFVQKEDIFYYLTVCNENYVQAAMPAGVDEGILKGMYLFRSRGARRQEALGQDAATPVGQRCDLEPGARGAADPGSTVRHPVRRLLGHELQAATSRRHRYATAQHAASRRQTAGGLCQRVPAARWTRRGGGLRLHEGPARRARTLAR